MLLRIPKKMPEVKNFHENVCENKTKSKKRQNICRSLSIFTKGSSKCSQFWANNETVYGKFKEKN